MSGELIRVGDTAVQFLVTGSESGGSAAVFEASIQARGRMPAPHSHDGFEETVYGLEGVSTWTVDGTAVDVAAGDALCIRHGAVHHFDNHSDVDAKALCVTSSRPVCSARNTFKRLRRSLRHRRVALPI